MEHYVGAKPPRDFDGWRGQAKNKTIAPRLKAACLLETPKNSARVAEVVRFWLGSVFAAAKMRLLLVIVAGRYGSIGKAGISYTEQEFDYAVRIGKPVIGFYHRDLSTLPGAKLQPGDDARIKLAAFAKKVKERLCRAWSTPEELGL